MKESFILGFFIRKDNDVWSEDISLCGLGVGQKGKLFFMGLTRLFWGKRKADTVSCTGTVHVRNYSPTQVGWPKTKSKFNGVFLSLVSCYHCL